jgi:hypothetical protein
MFDTISHPKQRAFLTAYAACGIVEAAAKIAGISRESHYDWKAENAVYAAAFERARQLAADALEDESTRRAQLGVREPFVYRGQVVMHEGSPLMRRRYSDTLLLAMLRARKDEYKEKTAQEVSGPGGKPIQHRVDLRALTNEELALLEQLSRKACRAQPERSGDGGALPVEELERDPRSGGGPGGSPETPEAED